MWRCLFVSSDRSPELQLLPLSGVIIDRNHVPLPAERSVHLPMWQQPRVTLGSAPADRLASHEWEPRVCRLPTAQGYAAPPEVLGAWMGGSQDPSRERKLRVFIWFFHLSILGLTTVPSGQ